MGKRIVVIGNAGGGKSRLAEGLARNLALPLYRLDSLQWNPGWIATPESEFRHRHDALAATDAWVLDGVASWESIVHRIERCDTVVFVDLPIGVHYWWAFKRQIMCVIRPRPNFVPGCPMLPMTGPLVRMMWWIHKTLRPKLKVLIESHRGAKHLYILRSPRDVNDFYDSYCTQ